jgi:hypothetical protein
MLIWTTSLLAQESQGITTLLRGHQSDPARSAQMVNREKDLVPREVEAATHHLFQVAPRCRPYDVDYLIFRADLLRHVPPFEERKEFLRG